MKIEIVYGDASEQYLLTVDIEKGSSVKEALVQAQLSIDLEKEKVGIFSEVVEIDKKLREGDRIEIYRPLKINPKEARRLRAGSKR